jgi:peroxiredoxin
MYARSARLPRSSILLIPIVLACVAAGPPRADAQQPASFGDRPTFDITVPPFTDAQIAGLVSTLDAMLGPEQGPAVGDTDPRMTLWNFARQLQTGRLTPAQESRVLRHLTDIARARPEDADVVHKSQFMVRSLTVGKTAPDIVGVDLEGHALRLSDYRGKVVALVFSGDWCGICRSEYPYERLLLELYKNWPFAIVGVDSGVNRAADLASKTEQGLTFRSWWDPPATGATEGPIASAWNVVGWPTVYVIDAQGVIRFVDLREEDLLKGVRQLLTEQVAHTPAPAAGGR